MVSRPEEDEDFGLKSSPHPAPAGCSLRENAAYGRSRRRREARGDPSRTPAEGEGEVKLLPLLAPCFLVLASFPLLPPSIDARHGDDEKSRNNRQRERVTDEGHHHLIRSTPAVCYGGMRTRSRNWKQAAKSREQRPE